MSSLVILWESNMETTHNYIEEEKSFPENDILSSPSSYQNLTKTHLGNSNNLKNLNLNYDNVKVNNETANNLEDVNCVLNSNFSNEGLFDFKKKTNSEQTLNYKNKNFPVTNYEDKVNPRENIAENLSKFFEKMVYQLEIITSYIFTYFFRSFKKFDNRLSTIEDMMDEIKLDTDNQERLENNSIQKEEIEKEFLNQINSLKNTKGSIQQNIENLQKDFYGVVEKNKIYCQNPE